MPNNKINKILFDVSLPEEDKNDALKKAKDLFYSKILNVINEVMDDYKGVVSIPKLDIDLGVISENDLEDVLKSAIIKQLQKAPQSTEMNDQKITFLAQHDTLNNRENILSSTDHFIYFLQHGYWPWHMQNEPENIIHHFLVEYLKDDQKTNVLFQLLPHQTTDVLDRLLIVIFSDTKLVKPFLHSLQQYHTLFELFILLLPSRYELTILMEQGFVYMLYRQLLNASKLQSLNDIKLLVLKTFTDGYNDKGTFMKLSVEKDAWLRQNIQATQSANDIRILIDDVLEMQFDAVKNVPIASDKSGEPNVNDVISDNERVDEMAHQQGFKRMLEDEDGKISIPNAGLILFHLYLPYIFKDLKWIDATNKFVDAKRQQKAIHFLQYLIDGKSRHDEHILILNKMLCGWPIHLPITLKCNFSKKEKDIAKEAIDSLKEHWAVMKNTSAQGLMESFVIRQGIIQRNQSGYLLQIERKTIDILLDSLPFGIGTIKLPWNEYIISTEW